MRMTRGRTSGEILYASRKRLKVSYERAGRQVVRIDAKTFVVVERSERDDEWRTATKSGGRYQERGLSEASRIEVLNYALHFGLLYRTKQQAIDAVDEAANVEELMP